MTITRTRLIILIFITGILIGVAFSPWANTKQKNPFTTKPQPTLASSGNILPSSPKASNTLAFLFHQFDKEQEFLSEPTSSSLSKFKVLGAQIENSAASYQSGEVTIAVLGDSMVDTMGTNLPYLEKALKRYYPNIQFTLFNYGVGGENAEKAAERSTNSYSYKDRSYPPLAQLGADIIIIESYAYNPMETGDSGLSKHTRALNQIISSVKQGNAKILFLATIAPLKSNFGQGPGGVNWPLDIAWNHATTIQQYMENGIIIAQSHGIPVIDAYHSSQNENGEGIQGYVSSHDGIHPSASGHIYIANLIAQKIVQLRMF